MASPRVFVSFDFDHDEELKNALAGQARMENVPFEFADWSLKEPVSGDWKEEARERIRRSAIVWVICGAHTNTAAGVSAEVRIAREEGKPVHFIRGRSDKTCKLPKAAAPEDEMLDWTWENLVALIGQETPSGTAMEPAPADSWGDRIATGVLLAGGLFMAKRILDALTESRQRPYDRVAGSTRRW